jgi:hypothetical protein
VIHCSFNIQVWLIQNINLKGINHFSKELLRFYSSSLECLPVAGGAAAVREDPDGIQDAVGACHWDRAVST